MRLFASIPIFLIGIFTLGVGFGHFVIPKEKITVPQKKFCPEPRVRDLELVKDCEFQDGCTFESIYTYQRNVRHLLQRESLCRGMLEYERSDNNVEE